MAGRQWGNSASSSFAFLVTACESLTERGLMHRVYCDQCKGTPHTKSRATERFRAFFETFAPARRFELGVKICTTFGQAFSTEAN